MPIKDKGVVKRVIVTPDKHFPFADKKAIGCLIKAIEIVKPDTYVDLGDVGEWHGASHWKWKKKKRPPLEYIIDDIEQDIEDVNKGLDIIDEMPIVKNAIMMRAMGLKGNLPKFAKNYG